MGAQVVPVRIGIAFGFRIAVHVGPSDLAPLQATLQFLKRFVRFPGKSQRASQIVVAATQRNGFPSRIQRLFKERSVFFLTPSTH